MKTLHKVAKNPVRTHAPMMMNVDQLADARHKFRSIAKVTVIRNKADYSAAIKLLDQLIDVVGRKEAHPPADLPDIVGMQVEQYEDARVTIKPTTPREVLIHLMEEHQLAQSDLSAEIGSQGVVSKILSGKRNINARQAKALAVRLSASAAVFI